MKCEHIHEALKERGLSWSAVGDALNCSYQHVMNVCSRRSDSRRVAKAVSLLIDKEVNEVFPDKPQYAEDAKSTRKKKLAIAKKRLAEAGLIEAA